MSAGRLIWDAAWRLLGLCLAVLVGSALGWGWTFSWRFAVGMLVAMAAWDWYRSRQPTERRHYDAREVDMDLAGNGVASARTTKVSIVSFTPNMFLGDEVSVVSSVELPLLPDRMNLQVHHDVVELRVGGNVILTAPNPEYRGGRRMSVGVLLKGVNE